MTPTVPGRAALTVRPLREDDLPAIVAYWTGASREDLDRMGVDVAKLPSAEALQRSLVQLCRARPEEAPTFYLIWEVARRAVGYASLKDIRHGESGAMHLHIWDPGTRGKGYGAALFSLSALEFFERFALRRIVCEPKADNAMPNRMLAKAGYPLIGSRVGASSELSAICTLNVYAIEREVAQRVVDLHARSSAANRERW